MRSLVLAAALALAACGPPGAPAGAGGQQTSTATAPPAQPSKPDPFQTAPAAPAAPSLDRAFMIGRWGDNGDCSKDVVLNGDGSFTSYTGGEGQWSLNGSTLRMEGKASTLDLQLQLIDHDNLRITNPDGSVGTSQRC